jgi:hypothetical protein
MSGDAEDLVWRRGGKQKAVSKKQQTKALQGCLVITAFCLLPRVPLFAEYYPVAVRRSHKQKQRKR